MQGKLHGVILCEDDELTGMKTNAIRWGSDMRLALALCNDLIPLHRNTLAGQPDEKKVFKSIEATYLVCLSILVRMLCQSSLCATCPPYTLQVRYTVPMLPRYCSVPALACVLFLSIGHDYEVAPTTSSSWFTHLINRDSKGAGLHTHRYIQEANGC